MSFVKNVRVKMLVPALLTAVFAVPAMADQYSDTARVLSSTPQIERVNVPRQECRTEYQQQSYSNGGNNSMAGAIIGGIAGGLLGNTVGRGNGRVAAAAVGAGVGAIAGNSIANNQRGYGGTRSVPVQTCYQVDNWQSVTTGYLVSYEYNGRTYSTVTNEQPGRYIDVNVAIEPRSRVVSQVSYVEPANYNRGWDDDHDSHDRGRRGWDKHDDDRGDRRYY
ncbi:glycine zipper 2TM domain-containing protein [Methylotenera sp.]|uniref:glycine zipper 2TM domain-containing protein n=1 Tax=Methylotenera sp. TaxID=2051956 RepID=UPI0024879802|nr:glycine zipper 2TM domain-containing protein [Methylotenera sp.]MDI1362162.1 glycine zipper 2TM domain-containing protein [Methylotenera sp.]